MMKIATALVVTSVAQPTDCMLQLAEGARARSLPFYCIGDVPSPTEYMLAGCEFLSIKAQRELPYTYAAVAPERHYARKNIGYLHAMANGAQRILETDDDNFPTAGFWNSADVTEAVTVNGKGWYNVYEWFGADAWPRGFPLERVLAGNDGFYTENVPTVKPLIWQGLVAGDPDVDAIYRLTRRSEIVFREAPPICLTRGVWSPFNSQNTLWARKVFPFMYLPATCSFRATDIIRGYVAMRCLWELEGAIAFIAPTALQVRNVHDLMRDFIDESVIYTDAARIVSSLEKLDLDSGLEARYDNLRRCYENLVDLNMLRIEEMDLLTSWINDARKFDFT